MLYSGYRISSMFNLILIKKKLVKFLKMQLNCYIISFFFILDAYKSSQKYSKNQITFPDRCTFSVLTIWFKLEIDNFPVICFSEWNSISKSIRNLWIFCHLFLPIELFEKKITTISNFLNFSCKQKQMAMEFLLNFYVSEEIGILIEKILIKLHTNFDWI